MSRDFGLIIFAREPKPGEVKSRLAAGLGQEKAAEFYSHFLHDTLTASSRLSGAQIFIAWAGSFESGVSWVRRACPRAELLLQQGATLGDRLTAAVEKVRRRGFQRVVVIGSDSPSLPIRKVLEAVRRLRRSDLVMGPARDGGFYLIAGNSLDSRLLSGVSWGSESALDGIRKNAERMALCVDLLAPWYDIDDITDLGFLASHLHAIQARDGPIPCPFTWEALCKANVGEGRPKIGVVTPALNEEASIGRVLDEIPPGLAAEVVVVDNGSTDSTAATACAHGASVIFEPKRGYGSACLTGIRILDRPDVIVFLDADHSDHSEEMNRIVAPILEGRADLVIGSRMAGKREPGALPLHSRFGNWLSAVLLQLLYGQSATDLGPFRAIRADALMELDMRDEAFGWTMEMQAKAARARMRTVEVPVSYRRRIGKSKITGTLKGSVKAGMAIIWMALKTRGWKADWAACDEISTRQPEEREPSTPKHIRSS